MSTSRKKPACIPAVPGFSDTVSPGESPAVSVVLPFYNAEKYLMESARSVLDHDYQSLELLLVDDKSTDRSPEIARYLKDIDSRVRVITHDINRGAGMSRNTGVATARGRYIFFLDSDDLLQQGALKLLLETAEREGVEVVIGSCEQIDEAGVVSDHDRIFDSGDRASFGLFEGDEAVRRWLGIDWLFLPVRTWGILIETELLHRSGLQFSPGEHEDLSFTPFIYKFAGRVVYLKDIVYLYRIRAGSIMNSPQTVEKIRRYERIWEDTSIRISAFGLERFRREFKIFHIGHLLWILGRDGSDRETLEAAADLISRRMSLAGDRVALERKRNLSYLLEDAWKMLEKSGEAGNTILWERVTGTVGDDILCRFIRKRLMETAVLIWRVQMNTDENRDDLARIKEKISDEDTGQIPGDDLEALRLENERLRKRLTEVSFYLNELLTAMEKRAEVSEGRPLKPWPMTPGMKRLCNLRQLVHRVPILRSLVERRVINRIRKSGQFSPEYYRETYHDLDSYKGDLLVHFVRYGGFEGRSPNPYFDSKWYFNANPGVKKKGINPLYHYLTIGSDAGLWPSPDYGPAEYASLVKGRQ